ncbi:tRNA-dihydrouridine synthase family protein [Pelagicoccus albus]|uniref:tRNA-dihydrouridine synthase n=2 Tax=Pelagicoccus albus TaxID=415222 RepID=A0A7X1E8D3_9BACT|nr:tRNA-dihydrouridine synthase family protein [Pelagicoccus albus]
MQDVTDLPFMAVIANCGAPDYFVTEYFRVHSQSRLEKHILEAVTENRTGRPVFAQMIGEDIHHLVRSAKDLQEHPIAGVDLNMGCPSPTVYKKQCGGGLLRDPQKVDQVLGALREAVPGLFTVKMRIGFSDTENFETILDLVNKHQVDLLSLHGRTVKEMYRSEVHYDFIKRAAERISCPLLANGDITSAAKARQVLDYTGAAGVMVGRHAIRNPWIFQQIRDDQAGLPISEIPLYQVNRYIKELYEAVSKPHAPEQAQVNKMKKYLNFVGQGVDPEGKFLYEMRRAKSKTQLFDICDRHMPEDGDGTFAPEPYQGVIARPNCES